MDPNNIFGANAGKVWNVLNKYGAVNSDKISKMAKLNINEVYGALGWLGREGKVIILEKEKTLYYQLA